MAATKTSVMIIGAGYAGLACALDLLRARQSSCEVTLVNRDTSFLNLTQLHRTVGLPIDALRFSLADFAARKGARFIQADVPVTRKLLGQWNQEQRIKLGDEIVPFDFLVLATGAAPSPSGAHAQERVLGLGRLKREGLRPHLERFLETTPSQGRAITLVGGGATGLQFLFDLDDRLRSMHEDCMIHLVHEGERLLPSLPAALGAYAMAKVRARGGTIWPHLRHRFLAQEEHEVVLQDAAGRERYASQLTLLLGGVGPYPFAMTANSFGQVAFSKRVLPGIFACGDCARFAGHGLNALTAQAAVRKGKLVAENILRTVRGEALLPYDYCEQGYFVSLGALDGAGWWLAPGTILTGAAAFAIKSAVEAQFDLLLGGVDTYGMTELR